MRNLVNYLAKIKDPRKAKGIRHDQTTTLLIMIMSIMCNHIGLNALEKMVDFFNTNNYCSCFNIGYVVA